MVIVAVRSLLILSSVLRIVFLLYGLYQDATSVLKYTDIDYLVFTDAARYVSHGQSPYLRATYRYTPLLSWLLVPTIFPPQYLWFSFGKVLFAAGDILAGYLIIQVLRNYGMTERRAMKYASLWLLNPMVMTISTRGSSEGLLGAMVIALLWAVEKKKVVLSGLLLGLGVHFKIYPFVYGPSILLWMRPAVKPAGGGVVDLVKGFATKDRIVFTAAALGSFTLLNIVMFSAYGHEFVQHTFLHHVTRLDHRHNFSPYNTLLYLNSSPFTPSFTSLYPPPSTISIERLAFLPQLLLSSILIPFFAPYNLPTTMFAQTFAFVTFNKVVTSQYFMWYLVLLPFYLPHSSLLRKPFKGILALFLWVVTQAAWLTMAFELEFMGGRVVVGDIGRNSDKLSGSGPGDKESKAPPIKEKQ
ncbi:hypothetical protein ABW19_dt0200898 [Dactylella cylindrospora]|nr:hypothetical protein ABW19_dt0200898 [Dactylella cylindrospora]